MPLLHPHPDGPTPLFELLSQTVAVLAGYGWLLDRSPTVLLVRLSFAISAFSSIAAVVSAGFLWAALIPLCIHLFYTDVDSLEADSVAAGLSVIIVRYEEAPSLLQLILLDVEIIALCLLAFWARFSSTTRTPNIAFSQLPTPPRSLAFMYLPE